MCFGIPGGEIRAAVEKVVTSQCDHLAAPVLERLLTHLDMTLTEAVAPSSTLSPFSTTGGSVLLNSESEQEPSAVVQQA
ncbi:unnamed protein product [Amoebophrya sp. A25]|nr:unnamed protein product [Amoebophrya sp. A25]|eukprot:GSA25T00015024001.1